MATQNLIEQHIIFISSDNEINESVILANSLVQSLANNSVGNDLIASFQSYWNWNGTVWSARGFYELKCFVSTAFQATIQANIPNLQAAFPTFTIVTWGYPVTWGS